MTVTSKVAAPLIRRTLAAMERTDVGIQASRAVVRRAARSLLALAVVTCASGCLGSASSVERSALVFGLVQTGRTASDLRLSMEATNVSDGHLRLPLLRVSESDIGGASLAVELDFTAMNMNVIRPGVYSFRSIGKSGLSATGGRSPSESPEDVDITLAPGEKWSRPLEETVVSLLREALLRDSPRMSSDTPYELEVKVTFSNRDLTRIRRRSREPDAVKEWFGKVTERRTFIWRRHGTGFVMEPAEDRITPPSTSQNAANPAHSTDAAGRTDGRDDG